MNDENASAIILILKSIITSAFFYNLHLMFFCILRVFVLYKLLFLGYLSDSFYLIKYKWFGKLLIIDYLNTLAHDFVLSDPPNVVLKIMQ